MKQFIICLVALLGFSICHANNLFTLQKDGTYLTENGNIFAIVNYDGKSAHEIYQKLKSNADIFYSNNTQILSTVEDYQLVLTIQVEGGVMGRTFAGIYKNWVIYTYVFRIKDGAVQVWQPMYRTSEFGDYSSFQAKIEEIFLKPLNPKEKNPADWQKMPSLIEEFVNSPIKKILYGWPEFNW